MIDDVRRTLDLMDFYGKTVPRIIYVTTHNAVTAARTEISTSKSFFINICLEIVN